MKYRIALLAALLAVLVGWAGPAAAQGATCTPPANTINCQPAAVSLQGTDLLLGYQLAQTPHTRAPTVAQILATLQASNVAAALGYTAVQSATLTGAVTGTASGGPALSIATSYGSQAANTILANATSSPAAPLAFTMPSCIDTAGNHLNYVAGTGITCGTSGASGNVSTTGSPASGNLTKFSGATTITNGDLSGDVTTSGTLAATVSKIGGVSISLGGAFSTSGANTLVFTTTGNTALTLPTTGTLVAAPVALSALATQTANTVLANVTAGSASPTAAPLPGCTDTGGNHLNYTGGTGFSCGTSGSGGPPSGSAGGDLGGTYPNPTVVSVADVTTGTLPVANGGTGGTTAEAARANINQGISTLSAASSTIATPNFAAHNVYSVQLVTAVGPYTLPNPSSMPAGTTFYIYILQPASGSTQSLSTYGTDYKFFSPYSNASPPSLTATLGAVDLLTCGAISTTVAYCNLNVNGS